MTDYFDFKKFYKSFILFFIGGVLILNGVMNITLYAFHYGKVSDQDAITRARELGYVELSEIYTQMKEEEKKKGLDQ